MEENQVIEIPKIIHYCWFGRNPLPKMAIRCISSWRRFFPDYEIKEWNEDNFDVNLIPYTRDAYAVKKYAFVSDYARFWILYRYGGIYFDTDVEVIKPMFEIVSKGPYLGIEIPGNSPGQKIAVNPGLGFAVQPGNEMIKEILSQYESLPFWVSEGEQNPYSMIPLITDLLLQKGLLHSVEVQLIDDVSVYPQDYFNPLDDATGRLQITENTCSIHWYTKSWISSEQRVLFPIKRLLRRLFGSRFLSFFKQR